MLVCSLYWKGLQLYGNWLEFECNWLVKMEFVEVFMEFVEIFNGICWNLLIFMSLTVINKSLACNESQGITSNLRTSCLADDNGYQRIFVNDTKMYDK